MSPSALVETRVTLIAVGVVTLILWDLYLNHP